VYALIIGFVKKISLWREGIERDQPRRKGQSGIMRKTDSNTLSIALGGTARSPEDVAALYDLGLDFAEVSLKDMSMFTRSISDFIELRSKTNLFYLCHGPNEGDPNDTTYLREHYLPRILEILDLMPMLDMFLLTLHLWIDHRFVKAPVIDLKIDLLGKIIDKAQTKNITICLENLSEDSNDLDKAFKVLSQLYLTLDIGHAQLLRPKTTAFDLIAAHPHRIKHLHLHDNMGGNTVNDDLHLPVGDGNVEFYKILGALKEAGYTGTATLDLKPEEIKRCLSFVRTLLW
jgi:sugar phosphate isomerase/epimerase